MNMQNYKIHDICGNGQARIYSIDCEETENEYYIVSSPEARKLIIDPETIGYTCQQCLLPSTQSFLQYLSDKNGISRPHIFNILRGGLNFPLEEACFNIGVKVCNTDFVTCERVIEDGVIKGLDIRYEKIIAEENVTLLIGDIIASGETLLECIPLIAKRYKDLGGSIRQIVFFTIGGTKAVTLMEKLTAQLRMLWPDFEGFRCIFYEGMFTVYEDKGVTGINTPDIDFKWQGGAVAPELREQMMQSPISLLEKCVIYDGGARRYEIHNHIEEVNEYWHELNEVADEVDFQKFAEEKLGYPLDISYEQWLDATHLPDTESNKTLWQTEHDTFCQLLDSHTLKGICEQRIREFNEAMKEYSTTI